MPDNKIFDVGICEQNLVGIASARAGYIIGGGDWTLNRLIPDIFRSIHNNEKSRQQNYYQLVSSQK